MGSTFSAVFSRVKRFRWRWWKKDDGEGLGRSISGHADNAAEVTESDLDELAVNRIVDMYVQNTLISVPFLPNFVEKRFYGALVRTIVDEMTEAAGKIDVDFFGRRMTVGVSPMSARLIERACECSRRKRSPQQRKAQKAAIDRLTTRLLSDERINIGFVPDAIERGIYANVIRIVIGVMQDTFDSTSVSIMGHDLKFDFRAPLSEDVPGTEVSVANPIETIDPLAEDCLSRRKKAVESLVDKHMAKHNVFLIPDTIERRLYSTAYGIAIQIADEVATSSRVSLMHHHVHVSLSPSR